MAKYTMSAYEAKNLGYLTEKDTIVMNSDNLVYEAKAKVLELARNYRPKKEEDALKAPGRSIAASIKAQIYNLKWVNISPNMKAILRGNCRCDVWR